MARGFQFTFCLLLVMGSAWISPTADAADLGRIMPLGDSITDGQGTGGYRGTLGNLLTDAGHDFTFVGSVAGVAGDHEGHPGYQIAGIQAGIASWLASAQPDYILLMIGTNDFNYGNGYNIPQMLEKYDALVSDIVRLTMAQGLPTKLIIGSITPINSATFGPQGVAFNAGLPDLVIAHPALGERVSFVNLHRWLTFDDLRDSVHPNASGYAKLGDAWFDAITETIEPRTLGGWRHLNGLAVDGSQDLDESPGHGIPNLLAFAFNTAPDPGDLARAPAPRVLQPGGTRGLPMHWAAGGKHFFQFIQRKTESAPGITYFAERTTDLAGTWAAPVVSPPALELMISSIDDTWERVTYEETIGSEPVSYRVRVIVPDAVN